MERQAYQGNYQQFIDEVVDDEDDIAGVSEFNPSADKSKNSLQTLEENKDTSKISNKAK